MIKSDICERKGESRFSVGQEISSKLFEPMLISVLALAVSGAACGGSEKKDDVPADMDAGIVLVDSGMSEHDASVVENDAGIPEDDAGTGEKETVYIPIPNGEYTVTHDGLGYSSGKTIYFVSSSTNLDFAFTMKKTPVTVSEFEKCVAAEACTSKHYKTASDDEFCNYNRGKAWKNHPMNCIDWYGAKEYCEWIGGQLPEETHWEYAATHNGTEHLYTT